VRRGGYGLHDRSYLANHTTVATGVQSVHPSRYGTPSVISIAEGKAKSRSTGFRPGAFASVHPQSSGVITSLSSVVRLAYLPRARASNPRRGDGVSRHVSRVGFVCVTWLASTGMSWPP
jgi:hypothetical protein